MLNIRAEAAPQKRLALLDQWKAKYPKTELQQVRQELYLAAWQSLGDSPHMLAVAREMIAGGTDSLIGLYWFTLLVPEAKEVTPDLLGAGEKAARQLLAGLNTYFAAGNRPAATTPEAWQKRRGEAEFLAHRALGWIQWQRADYPAAEAEFTKCPEQDPESRRNFRVVRDGAGAGPAAGKPGPSAVATRARGILPRCRRAARRTAATTRPGPGAPVCHLPRRDSRTRSVADCLRGIHLPARGIRYRIGIRRRAAQAGRGLNRTNPQLASWIRIRRRLETPDGEAYFAASLHNTPLPMRLKGTLLRTTPAGKPKELVLGVGDATAEEVILKLESAFPNDAESGTVLEFEGTIDAFTKAPFTLTVWPTRKRSRAGPHGGRANSGLD